MGVSERVVRGLNRCISPLGVRLVRLDQDSSESAGGRGSVENGSLEPVQPSTSPACLPMENAVPSGHVKEFLDPEPLIRAAEESGLPLEVYLHQEWNCREHCEEVIGRIAAFGVFEPLPERVVEIGTGTGLFAEVVLRYFAPAVYESYEPDSGWNARFARDHPAAVAQPTDGMSLGGTGDASADLVIAHRVFVYLTTLTSLLYFREMARVLRSGGHAVFDVISEDCLDELEVDLHVARGNCWPNLLPKDYLIAQFDCLGFDFVGDFLRPLSGYAYYKTHYTIFRKR